jgi:flagellar biosynthesis protein FlhF
MKIKSFYSDSMDGALQSASKELGDEALILNTRETPREFLHFGRYEVVCAVAHEPRPEVPVAVAAKLAATARLVFLVGPSGAGKSSTCAKIAIHSKYQQGLNPAVISWDTRRVGGADSLRSYCAIAGIPFRETLNCVAFLEALRECGSNDLVLVDTPALEGGDSNPDEILEAIRLTPTAEVHLVLSGAFSTSYLQSSERAYARYGAACLLPTHLDQSRMDLSAAGMEALRGLTIRWCGTGRSVPEDLKDAGVVVEQAAAMEAPPVRTTIDTFLARFRRTEPQSRQQALPTSRSSAA